MLIGCYHRRSPVYVVRPSKCGSLHILAFLVTVLSGPVTLSRHQRLRVATPDNSTHHPCPTTHTAPLLNLVALAYPSFIYVPSPTIKGARVGFVVTTNVPWRCKLYLVREFDKQVHRKSPLQYYPRFSRQSLLSLVLACSMRTPG